MDNFGCIERAVTTKPADDPPAHSRLIALPSPTPTSRIGEDNDDQEMSPSLDVEDDQGDDDYVQPIEDENEMSSGSSVSSDGDHDSSLDDRPFLDSSSTHSDDSRHGKITESHNHVFLSEASGYCSNLIILVFNLILIIDLSFFDLESGEQNASIDSRTPTTCPISMRLLSLRAWQIRNKITSKAMQDFLTIAPSVGLNDLPEDWRRVIRLETRLKLSSEVSEIVEVCSNCFLHRFPPEVIAITPKCSFCSYTRLFCPRCDYRCILASSIGNKSKKYIAHCMACGANSGVKVTVRSYIFNVAEHLAYLFSHKDKAMALLQPFQNETEQLFSLKCPVTGHFSASSEHVSFEECHGWLEKWRTMCQNSKFFKELWHGERFYSHSIFEQHGMRSVLFEVSLDWFPPHKDKQKYSVGVLSCAPANLSLHQRSDMSNIFVLAVIEGPSEPVHTLALLQPVFKNFASIDAVGLKVFDSLTNSNKTVHATVALLARFVTNS